MQNKNEGVCYMKKRKIAFVINTIKKSGPGNVVLNLMKNIDSKKNQITLLTLFNGNDSQVVKELRKDGIDVIECNEKSKIKFLINGHKRFEAIFSTEYNIVHTHGFIPDIVSSRSKISAKKITTIHNNMFEDYRQTYGKWRARIYIFLHLKFLKKLDQCVGCSKYAYDSIQPFLNNAIYIRNGIDLTHSTSEKSIRKKLGIPKEATIFIYVGVLSKLKNIIFLIENFKKIHNENEYLLILGEGEEYETCINSSNSNIKILGFQHNPEQYLNISDIYTSASSSEGLSISIIEALNMGLGLFLSDIPSHKEILEIDNSYYLGEVFAKDNFEDLFKIIRNKKIDNKKVKEFQKKYLSGKVMARNYEDIYNKLLKEIE